MKIAYLITVHDNPKQLSLLISKIKSDFSDIFIHVDKKCNIDDFKNDLVLNELYDSNVIFIRDRISVEWMGFSQVQSTLNLINYSMTHDDYKYFVFLSGSDYPLKSNKDIYDLFLNSNKEYLSFWKIEDRPSWKHKIEYYYPIDKIGIRNWKSNYKKNVFSFIYWGGFFSFRKFAKKRKYFPDIIPYGGSGWWMLTKDCCKYILDYVSSNKSFVSYYKYTHAPDEMFFQTIIMNSEYNKNVNMFNDYLSWSSVTSIEDKLKENTMLSEQAFNLRYVDWSGRKGQFPVVLDTDDYKKMINSNCIFARKFSLEESGGLIKLLNEIR
ncbi:beta-1,6-N-acetylglucosaminyltransferase [Photobacterium kishitanii]|uniref:beta-1,6-N-acetylglucosaminyltransferase n=1 Tax=Photobacterium kishitanii TaxID=318456 RepID=UPI000D1671F0|nr:beta-1,6-N-acetylglucosaminyltransferase [Photobacterium kishitanii]PSV23004.1 hypothetical protein C0W28_05185 [Photobacterium kishitanii]